MSPSKFANIRLHRGDRVRITSPSGGGYGPPLERDPQRVSADVRERIVSVESAARLYGVVIDGSGEVDGPATKQLRAEMWDGLAADR